MKVCKDGEHTWEEIYRKDDYWRGDEVVCWCAYCGSVVIDINFDGRISPGAVMKIKNPQLMKDLVKE